ncbi:integrase catalytic domain-containing protein [Trichonephila clavipes]|nr:integrase catalytic domain-containing protein [Trichonephila clavipes]
MVKGYFNLRGWESNVPGLYISRSSGVTSLLGLLWDLDKDTLKCNLNYSGEGRKPVSLPSDRANDAAVFEVVGVDIAGPLYVKGGQKSWIVLFTCATYRTVQLELTSSLSSDAFLLSLRRFIARRGRSRVIYSDNVKNFRGAQGELSGIDWEKISKLTTIQRIIWKFNPPTAGWRERLIHVLRNCSERLLVTYCTYLSENSDDLVPLSPAMFLVENRNLDVPDIDYRDTVNLRKRVRAWKLNKGKRRADVSCESGREERVSPEKTAFICKNYSSGT